MLRGQYTKNARQHVGRAWIALVLLWLLVTVLRGCRERFAFGALVAGLTAALSLNLLNPQALIARVNAERVATGAEYDVAYAGRLSGDAVPALVDSLDRLPAQERYRLAGVLLEHWGKERPGGWRTFNAGDWRARHTVAEARVELEAARCEPGVGIRYRNSSNPATSK
jgi:hypothetical protein